MSETMSAFIEYLLFLGGLAAAAAVGGMCVIALLVWLSGFVPRERTEAWRPADES